jgi:hypothetical protein
MGWLSNNLAPHYVRATGIGFQIALANCAAFVAVFTYLAKDGWVIPSQSSFKLTCLLIAVRITSSGIASI